MQLHQLQRTTPNKKKKRVGRGGTRGKTSGRGHKGQKSRAGGTPRPQLRDIIKKIPKRRGYGKNRARTVHSGRKPVQTVNLGIIERSFESGEMVNPKTLAEKGLIKATGRAIPSVKILGTGALTKKVSVEGCDASASARTAIEKTGGTVK